VPLPPATDDQKPFSDTVETKPPVLLWIRTWLFSIVTRWLRPAAPWVSGGMTLIAGAASGRAAKLSAGAGESGIGPTGPWAAGSGCARGSAAISSSLIGTSTGVSASGWGMVGTGMSVGDRASCAITSARSTTAWSAAWPRLPEIRAGRRPLAVSSAASSTKTVPARTRTPAATSTRWCPRREVAGRRSPAVRG
jgi:hypothetical protein